MRKNAPQLSGVHITRKHLEATNGHALVRMELTENVINFDDDTDVDLIIRFCGGYSRKGLLHRHPVR
ncbi:hypothetical protein [Xenorhabdus bovienii]|uniref:hypothetical protein n=1 Tax=Xenorhabdus bovienii TaxID=40576 RepID=UPI003DA4724E